MTTPLSPGAAPTRHWRVPPESDHRTWLPPSQRTGRLEPGHREPQRVCPLCPPIVVTVEVVVREPPRPPSTPPPGAERAPERSWKKFKGSQPEKMLLASSNLPRVFRWENLTILCWKTWPRDFQFIDSLGNAYPHAARVQARMYRLKEAGYAVQESSQEGEFWTITRKGCLRRGELLRLCSRKLPSR